MKTKLTMFALASIFLSQFCLAQTNEPASDWKSASSNGVAPLLFRD
jgi:hypothetical protein